MKSIERLFCLPLLFLAIATAALRAEDPNPAIEFLDKAAAAIAILDDKKEPYFDLLQPAEMSAKTGSPITGDTLEAQRAECRKRYQNATLDFSDDEKTLLRTCIEKLYPAVLKNYPLFAKVPWKFIKVSDDIEGAFPHTRGPCIIIAGKVLTYFKQVKADTPEVEKVLRAGSVLLHEQFHVFQRQNPELIAKMYTSVWGFKHVDKIDGSDCAWLVQRHLANPDGLDCGWILPIKDGDTTRIIWPLVVFRDTDLEQKMGPDFRMIAVSLQENNGAYSVKLDDEKVPECRDLMDLPDYRKRFSPIDEFFHPNEISAEMFARIVCIYSYIPDSPKLDQAKAAFDKTAAPVRAWLRENLKEK